MLVFNLVHMSYLLCLLSGTASWTRTKSPNVQHRPAQDGCLIHEPVWYWEHQSEKRQVPDDPILNRQEKSCSSPMGAASEDAPLYCTDVLQSGRTWQFLSDVHNICKCGFDIRLCVRNGSSTHAASSRPLGGCHFLCAL